MVAAYVESGDTLDVACEKVMSQLDSLCGVGGLIAISGRGEVVFKYNTDHLSVGLWSGH